MKQEIILSIAILSLLSLAVFVSAVMVDKGNGKYEVTIHDFREGWNLVPGIIPNDALLEDSEVKLNNIKAVWYYSPIQKKYLQVHPNTDWTNLQKDDDDFVLTNAMWIYSDISGTLKYNSLEDYPSLEKRQLYEGWNFVAVTPDMSDPKFGDIFSSCKVLKIASWDNEMQGWGVIPFSTFENEKIGANGIGLAIKVSEDCKLGSSQTNEGVNPPSLPQSETIHLALGESQIVYNKEITFIDSFDAAGADWGIEIKVGDTTSRIHINQFNTVEDLILTLTGTEGDKIVIEVQK